MNNPNTEAKPQNQNISPQTSRRDFLKTVAMGATSALLAACGGGKSSKESNADNSTSLQNERIEEILNTPKVFIVTSEKPMISNFCSDSERITVKKYIIIKRQVGQEYITQIEGDTTDFYDKTNDKSHFYTQLGDLLIFGKDSMDAEQNFQKWLKENSAVVSSH